MRAALTFTCFFVWSLAAIAQTRPAPGTQKPGMAPRPPLLFSETWKMPPYSGEQTDENTRVTPAVLTNANLEVKLYGADSKVIRAAVHEERVAFLVGAEGPGLTETAMRASDVRVRIPMSRGTDSLNVATAAALAFYERARLAG